MKSNLLWLAVALLLSWICTLALPWWVAILPPALIFGIRGDTGLPAFGLGFLTIAILWGAQASTIYMNGGEIIAQRVADMIQVGSPILLNFITALFGGLLSGFTALTLYFVKGLVKG